MNKTIVLKTATQVDNAISCIKQVLAEKEVHEVVIKPHRADRSLAQNRLLHRWFGEIAGENGEVMEDVKLRYKKKFLIDIFMKREDSEYAHTIGTLRDLYQQGHKKDAMYLHEQVVKLTSTAEANVAEMTEFLNLIEMDAATHGIQLSRPDDLYSHAVGS